MNKLYATEQEGNRNWCAGENFQFLVLLLLDYYMLKGPVDF